MEEAAFQRWIPLANQVVRRTLDLRWKDVFEIYSYIPHDSPRGGPRP